jgi:hypothetical protein
MSRDEERRERALDELRADSRLTLGPLEDVQLPVVVETETVGEGIELVRDSLPDVDGVAFVHVVSVDFSDLETRDEKLPPRSKKKSKRGAL